MQMAKTSAALARLAQARLPYVSVMTDPTMGGVSASLAMLGDLNLAEPRALIGFAGPRVIQQTVRETLPEGFQRSEFLLEHGAVDMIVDRRDMRERIGGMLRLLMKQPRARGLDARDPARTLAEWLDVAGAGACPRHRLRARAGRHAWRATLGRGAPALTASSRSAAPTARARRSRPSRRCCWRRGLRVGTLTSPHLLRYNERIRIGGREATDAAAGRACSSASRRRAARPR